MCIGKIDPKTGDFVPSKRLDSKQAAARDPQVTATSKVVGPDLVFRSITEELGLENILKDCFPDSFRQIMTLAQFLVNRGGPLSYCELWSKTHSTPLGVSISSQRISEVLSSISENSMQGFFKKWTRKVMEDDYLCYDITSVSSYAELNEYLKYGYNRDGDKLKQINIAMLFGQNSKLPVFYRRLPGSISDVATVHNLLDQFSFLELPRMSLVLDRGFFSQRNIDAIISVKDKFTIAVPKRVKWLQSKLNQLKSKIQSPEFYHKVDGETLYVHSQLFPWGESKKRCYLHVYYNAYRAAEAFDGFTEELLDYQKELKENRMVPGHEKAYSEFFTVTETPVRGRRVKFNDEAIQEYRDKYAGFYAILSNDIKDPMTALEVYRNKDAVEKCFNDLKNQLDMKRLRVHNSTTMDGRLFVQFIALIYLSAIRRRMKGTDLRDKFTTRELVAEMETIVKVEYAGKYSHLMTEFTKTQRDIIEKLKIQIET